MSQFTLEQNKINTDIAKKLDISIREVEKVLDLYHKGISIKLRLETPCEIIVPFLGRFTPKKTFIKEFNEKQNEVSSTGG